MSSPAVFTLQCAVQQYHWGKIGEDSEVARLSQSGNKDFLLNKDETYAELWMGTHPKAPSVISSTEHSGTPLGDWIKQHPECLGSKVRSKFNDQLPFLFKVLSVNKSLSIQAHPNKLAIGRTVGAIAVTQALASASHPHPSHAKQLHAARPDKYPDDNHKPEMALALTPFEGMNGFRPAEDILRFLDNVQELRAIVGDANAKELSAALQLDGSSKEGPVRTAVKKCFSALMNTSDDIIKSKIASLVNRLNQAGQGIPATNDRSKEASEGKSLAAENGDLVFRLNGQFPGDIGCFASYFFNLLVLQPGEAMFLGPNEPHAYLDGNCIECMACSDNVVRAGLTPKYKDVPTLCEMLTYSTGPPKERVFQSQVDPSDPAVTIYNPPVPDFAIARIKVPAQSSSYTVASYESASIIIVVEGAFTASHPSTDASINAQKGTIIFLAANESLPVQIESEGLLAFRAFCPLE